MKKYANVLSPIRVGKLVLKSRFVSGNSLPHFLQDNRIDLLFELNHQCRIPARFDHIFPHTRIVNDFPSSVDSLA